MNILIYGSRIIYGGGEKVLNWLANELLKDGHTVFFSTPHNDDGYQKKLDIVGLSGRVKIVEYPFHIKYRKPFRYFKHWLNIFKNNNIDVFVIFGGSLYEQIAARVVNTKILLSERVDPTSRPFLSRLLKQIQYRFSDGYVFQTKEAAECYGKRAVRLGTIIPNPIIDNLPDPISPNRKEVVSVGRLSPQKNQRLLLDAFSIFHKVYPDYKLVIYGSGPLRDELICHAKDIGIEPVFTIVEGERNIAELINGSELFVLSSLYEGMPNALIEAMAMGIVCISTDCPIYGPRMLVENGVNAFLVPLNDAEQLAQKMIEAMTCDSEAVRSEAIKIRERLSSQRIAKSWIDYFHRLVSGNIG